ncbi:Hypothetical predicted protein [Lecanosticta acicola]|uniref:Uncharacterized protein n=1 Tax=Lecanosticta acicola TaxID=111012 RepID=A0AAI8YUX3_9PEZI|nr:Hypothetical predicted protein [Lecanosticta acicola]
MSSRPSDLLLLLPAFAISAATSLFRDALRAKSENYEYHPAPQTSVVTEIVVASPTPSTTHTAPDVASTTTPLSVNSLPTAWYYSLELALLLVYLFILLSSVIVARARFTNSEENRPLNQADTSPEESGSSQFLEFSAITTIETVPVSPPSSPKPTNCTFSKITSVDSTPSAEDENRHAISEITAVDFPPSSPPVPQPEALCSGFHDMALVTSSISTSSVLPCEATSSTDDEALSQTDSSEADEETLQERINAWILAPVPPLSIELPELAPVPSSPRPAPRLPIQALRLPPNVARARFEHCVAYPKPRLIWPTFLEKNPVDVEEYEELLELRHKERRENPKKRARGLRTFQGRHLSYKLIKAEDDEARQKIWDQAQVKKLKHNEQSRASWARKDRERKEKQQQQEQVEEE